MGFYKNLDIRLRSGGDEAVQAASEAFDVLRKEIIRLSPSNEEFDAIEEFLSKTHGARKIRDYLRRVTEQWKPS